jgi:hypothetical protein
VTPHTSTYARQRVNFLCLVTLMFSLSSPSVHYLRLNERPHRVVVTGRDFYSESIQFQQFIAEVYTGEEGVVRGVFVPGMFAFPIIQQPEGNDIYVSLKPDLVTQFRQAKRHDVTGLLAHNYLSGEDFYQLKMGQEIWIVYGDKEIRRYQVSGLHEFQKLNPIDLYSNLLDLNTHEELSMTEVYHQFYWGSHHLIFQTCLVGEGRLDWGLFFVVAVPLDD